MLGVYSFRPVRGLTFFQSVKHLALLLFIAGALGMSQNVTAQTAYRNSLKYEGANSNFESNKNHQSYARTAEFDFDAQTRKVTNVPKIEFAVQEDVVLKFDIKVAANGSVAYVKPSRCAPEHREYWKGAIDALYSTQFEPGTENQPVKVTVTIPEVDFNRPVIASASATEAPATKKRRR